MKYIYSLICFFLFSYGEKALAQPSIILNLSGLDGVEINATNLFNYQVQSGLGQPVTCTVKGRLRYRNSNLQLSYSYNYVIRPGINQITADQVHPVWQYSGTALRELFVTYNKLPQGTYEYCVSVTPQGGGNEQVPSNQAEECLFYKVDDVFLINLLDPEDNAKIYEHNPMLSWTVNYPFASELTYRIRVCELRKGQNPVSAVTRNNPVYDEKNLVQTSVTYPVYARPLEVFQPYVWTVDAYYKGILLGGSEVWKFTIIEDEPLTAIPREQSYYDFVSHKEDTRLFAVGELRLKYYAEQPADSLTFVLQDAGNQPVRLPKPVYPLQFGDNRIALVFQDKVNLGHGKKYQVTVTTKDKKKYVIPFTYINPLYLK